MFRPKLTEYPDQCSDCRMASLSYCPFHGEWQCRDCIVHDRMIPLLGFISWASELEIGSSISSITISAEDLIEEGLGPTKLSQCGRISSCYYFI